MLQLLQLLQRQQRSFSLCYSDDSAASSADVPATTLQLSLQSWLRQRQRCVRISS
jgi:hypothetical protein